MQMKNSYGVFYLEMTHILMFQRNSLASEPFYVAKVKSSLQVVARICKQRVLYMNICLNVYITKKFQNIQRNTTGVLLLF